MNGEKKLHLALGTLAFLVFLYLLIRQETVPDYTMSPQAITILAGAIWAFMQIDIFGRDRGE